MFLSIIIPVYNAEKYIQECLESCFDQDLDLHDYEVICINDGSKDSSLQKLKKYADIYPNITIMDQSNQGVSSARNNGILKARGEYLWFIDADDTIKPNCLRRLKMAAGDKSDIISFSGYSYTESLSKSELDLLNANQLIGNMEYWGFVAVHIYRREIIRKNNILFDLEIAYGEDEMFYIDALANASCKKTIDDVLYLYRGHEKSAMNQLNNVSRIVKRLESVIRSMVLLKEGLENGKYVQKEAIELLSRRYELSPYLLAPLHRKDANKYLNQMYSKGLFSYAFLKKYSLPSEWHFQILYRKECFVDTMITLIKSFLPKTAVDYLKSLVKK